MLLAVLTVVAAGVVGPAAGPSAAEAGRPLPTYLSLSPEVASWSP